MRKKLLCILLTLAMIMTMLPMNAFAATWSRSGLWERVGNYVETLRQNGSREEGQASTAEEELPDDPENNPALAEPDENPENKVDKSKPETEKEASPSAVTLQSGQSDQSKQTETNKHSGDKADENQADGLSLGNPMSGDGVGAPRIITSSTRTVSSGVYYVLGTFTNVYRLEIIGNVEIVLVDGCNVRFIKGIHVPENASLTIRRSRYGTGSGKLEAIGEEGCAGIGANREGNAGMITIQGGTVTATGGVNAAGIGGGWRWRGRSDDITISGGTVTAKGGENAAGIGGGLENSVGVITISGGTVTATGGVNAAGIGGGRENRDGVITISGGTVTATGGNEAAGIGGGGHSNGCTVNISGNSSVTATGGFGAAGIGSGRGNADEHINGGTVNISGNSSVTAIGGTDGAGIGGGAYSNGATVNISDNSSVTATGGVKAAGIGSGRGDVGKDFNGGTVNISGGTVTATGGTEGAGIGGGYFADGATVTISGGTVTATGGFDTDGGGAGIGGGTCGSGCAVTITGGTVTATGGGTHSMGAAGIGGGYHRSTSVVTIDGGNVTATGGFGAAGIGAGQSGNDGSRGVFHIYINDGTVKATGGEQGAGIGLGRYGVRGYVTIKGGTVWAEGGDHCIGCHNITLGDALNVFNADGDTLILIDQPTPLKLNGAKKAVIGKIVPVPIVAVGLVYNGKEQTGYLNPDPKHTEVTGDTKATDAGNYTFTVTLNDGYTWSDDDTNRTKTFEWTISSGEVFVKADDREKTYGDPDPKLTAEVKGIGAGDTVNYHIRRQQGENVGSYTITPFGASKQGKYNVTFLPGTFTIRPKDVSENRGTDDQTIPEESGKFVEPSNFRDKTLHQDIPGTLTYTYDGKANMTAEQLQEVLRKLPAKMQGTIDWRFEASGNYKGTITGSIKFTITPRPEVSVAVTTDYIWFIPLYTATIDVKSLDNRAISRVEHSTTGLFYTVGKQMTSLFPITHFYIRVTTEGDNRYIYEYLNGEIIAR